MCKYRVILFIVYEKLCRSQLEDGFIKKTETSRCYDCLNIFQLHYLLTYLLIYLLTYSMVQSPS